MNVLLCYRRSAVTLTKSKPSRLLIILKYSIRKKKQKATFKWFSNGTITVPEDMSEVDRALKVAEKAKVDPLAYKSPMSLINMYSDIEIKEKRIDPDTVPTLSNKQDLGTVLWYTMLLKAKSLGRICARLSTHTLERSIRRGVCYKAMKTEFLQKTVNIIGMNSVRNIQNAWRLRMESCWRV